VLLAAGLVCYGLARYLAAPVETLRAGVRRLAGGDLSARVGARMGERRDEIADLSRDRSVQVMAAEKCHSTGNVGCWVHIGAGSQSFERGHVMMALAGG